MFSIAQAIFSNYGEMKFSYILTYKFSQDHLEIFFGQIHQRFGCNNNPNVMQFITAMKQLLLKNFIKCKNNVNCNVFDDDLVGGIFDFKWSRCKVDNYENQTLDDDVSQRALLLNSTNSDLNEAKNNILYYILGYIVRKIINILDCESSIQNLFEVTSDHSYAHKSTYSLFVDFKNRGGLISGSDSAFKVIIEAEKMFLILTNNLKKLNVQNLDILIIHHCIKKFSMDETIFLYLNCENITLTDKPHKIVLITVLTKQFLTLRFKSYGKMFSVNTLNLKSQRHKLNKFVLFTNQ